MTVLNFCLIFVYFLSQTKGLTFFKASQLGDVPIKNGFPFRSQSFLSQEEQKVLQHDSPLPDSLPLNESPIKPDVDNIFRIADTLPSFESLENDITTKNEVNNTQLVLPDGHDNELLTTQGMALLDNSEKSSDALNQNIVEPPDLTNKTASVIDHETKDIVSITESSNPFEDKNKIIDRTIVDTVPVKPDVAIEKSASKQITKAISSSSMGPLVIDKKHSLTDEIRGQFVPFQPYHASQELCFDVFTDLRQHPQLSSNAYLLFNILVSLDVASHGQPGQAIQEDKNVYVSMEELHHKGFLTLLRNFPCPFDHKNASDSSSCFHDRLSKCIADDKHGRTLYQTIISLGFEKSYQSFFVKSSLSEKTASGYDPLLSLDKEGNTLLHLAASSGSATILKDLLDRVASPATSWSFEPNVAEKGYYYILNAMNHPNHNNHVPLDLAKTSGIRLRLKRTYRTVIQFVRTLRAEDEKNYL